MTSQKMSRIGLLLFSRMVKKTEEIIYKLNQCLDLVIRVEKQRKKTMSEQCFRYQKFGHNQAQSKVNVRCLKCGDNHRTAKCGLSRVPATCAPCRKPNSGNYRGRNKPHDQRSHSKYPSNSDTSLCSFNIDRAT